MPVAPTLKVSYQKLLAILARQGKGRVSLIRDGSVTESTLDRIQRGENSYENTVRKLERGLKVDRNEFLESLPVAPPISATSTFTPITSIQKELKRLLEKVWHDQHFREFAEHFCHGLGRTDYLAALAESSDAHTDLLRMAAAVQSLAKHRNELELDVSNAIAHSAMVLFERHLGSVTPVPELRSPGQGPRGPSQEGSASLG